MKKIQMSKINFKAWLPHLIAVAIFFLVNVINFMPQLQGKKLVQGDLISNVGMSKEVKDYKDKTGIHSMWTGSMFGGMPTYQIMGKQNNNVARYINKALSLGLNRPMGLFIYAMIAFYIMMLLLGVNHWISIIASVAFGLSTNNIILLEAGHVTKLNTVFASPFIIAGVILAYRKEWLKGGSIFALGMALSLFANHIQMTYYLAISMLIFVIIHFVSAIRAGELKSFVTSSGILSLGLIIAIGTGAANLLTTNEYSKDTMRGKPILETNTAASNSSSEVEGLDFEYAMQWSNGFIDLFASYIPMAAGGGSGYTLDRDSEFAKAMKLRREIPAPVYFGDLPFTSGPAYFGAVVFLLFILGLFLTKGKMKWWIAISCLVYFLLSMGKNFEFFNKLFFNYLPLFNKFRTPNSILSVAALFFPLLGFYTVDRLMKLEDKSKILKPLYISAGILSVIALYFAFGVSATFDFQGLSDGTYQQRGYKMDAIVADRQSLLRLSSLRTLGFVLLTSAILYFWSKNKISNMVTLVAIGLLTFIDLFGVNTAYFSQDSFVSKRDYSKNFAARPIDKQILQDRDLHYRVHDISIDPFNSASTSYFHKTIGGYHPAKLQRYQDMIDYHISKGNQSVLDMLNMKYLIVPDQSTGQVSAQQNPNALGNAWFVSNVKYVKSANEEIESLNGFNPRQEAIIHNEFQSSLSGNYTGQGNIKLTSYAPNKLEYESSSTSSQLAVFSEVWYNKGWIASIDGKEVDFQRANYILRALQVPSGNHKIVFEFKAKTHQTGELISLIFSILLLLALGYVIYRYYQLSKNHAPS